MTIGQFSNFNGPVGSGACSAIFFPTSLEHDFYSFSKAVGKKVSSVVCEVEGILLGLPDVLFLPGRPVFGLFVPRPGGTLPGTPFVPFFRWQAVVYMK